MGLFEKSKMAANMAAMTGIHTVFGHNACCISAIVTILVSNHMFSNTRESFEFIF